MAQGPRQSLPPRGTGVKEHGILTLPLTLTLASIFPRGMANEPTPAPLPPSPPKQKNKLYPPTPDPRRLVAGDLVRSLRHAALAQVLVGPKTKAKDEESVDTLCPTPCSWHSLDPPPYPQPFPCSRPRQFSLAI